MNEVKSSISNYENSPLLYAGPLISDLLTNYLPINNANTTYEKVIYRDIEYTNLKNVNIIINIIYYCIVVLLFLLLFSDNNLYLGERFPLYIFLILLPFLYPWVYKFAGLIWESIFPKILYTGPKNAFIDKIYVEHSYDI